MLTRVSEQIEQHGGPFIGERIAPQVACEDTLSAAAIDRMADERARNLVMEGR